VNDQQTRSNIPTPKTNGSRAPVQIMAEINRTREEMDETLSAIEQRLTPGQLVDQGLDYLKHSGAREYAANLGSSIKNYPLPSTLAAIGIAWLMAVGNKQPQPSSGPSMGERMQSTKDSLGSSMQSTKDKVGNTMQSAKDSLTSGVQSARERASQLGDTASQLDRAKESWDSIVRDNPLVIGAVGLAIGAVVAALAPRTRTEDELMGETRDDLVDKAKQAGTTKLDQVKDQAKQAASSVKDAAADATKRQADQLGGQKPRDEKPQQDKRMQSVPHDPERRKQAPTAFPAPSAVEIVEDSTKWPASTPKR